MQIITKGTLPAQALFAAIVSPQWNTEIDNYLHEKGFQFEALNEGNAALNKIGITPDYRDFAYSNEKMAWTIAFVGNEVLIFGWVACSRTNAQLAWRFTNPGSLAGFKQILKSYMLKSWAS